MDVGTYFWRHAAGPWTLGRIFEHDDPWHYFEHYPRHLSHGIKNRVTTTMVSPFDSIEYDDAAQWVSDLQSVPGDGNGDLVQKTFSRLFQVNLNRATETFQRDVNHSTFLAKTHPILVEWPIL
jgi:hypothetical protein